MVMVISILIAAVLGVTTYIVLNQIVLGLIVGFVTFGAGQVLLERFIDKDAAYIRGSLRTARKKTLEIQQYGRKWRMWKIWFKIRYIRKINHEIISNIQKHPGRFPKADKFFSLYLDSTMNVLEKYDVLVHQPVRNSEVQESLRNTEKMLDDVIKGLEQQLSSVLEDDMMELKIEKEVIEQHAPK